MTTVAELLQRCREAGQEHLFGFWDELDDQGRAHLLGQVADLDFTLLTQLRELAVGEVTAAPAAQFTPPDVFPLARSEAQLEQARAAEQLGRERLSAGQVGFVLVAGGQGSRLGFDGPKGCFEIGPLSGRTLFGWHAARLLAARARYDQKAPWYIMTSASNDAPTRAFFAEQDHFGLGEENVFFFTQRMLPALDLEGRVLMAAKDSLFLAPNGHGGTLEALASSGALAHARERGAELLSYIQVDSPVARPTDPLFIGLHALAQADMSSKVVKKRDAGEKVGVLGLADGVLGCIEYSDLPEELRLATDPSGELLFQAGNIANHILSVEFVERLTAGGLDLPWHLARKNMTVVSPTGEQVECKGVKFETFIFDALGTAKNCVTLEVDRRTEFSPVKNAEGEDSPASCQADLMRTFAGWVEQAKGTLPAAGKDGIPRVEVDPRVAENYREFLARWPMKPRDMAGGHIYD